MSVTFSYTDVRLFHDRLRTLAAFAGELGMEAERAVLEDVLFASEQGTAQALADALDDGAERNGLTPEVNTKLRKDPDFPAPGWADMPGHTKVRRWHDVTTGTMRCASRRYW